MSPSPVAIEYRDKKKQMSNTIPVKTIPSIAQASLVSLRTGKNLLFNFFDGVNPKDYIEK